MLSKRAMPAGDARDGHVAGANCRGDTAGLVSTSTTSSSRARTTTAAESGAVVYGGLRGMGRSHSQASSSFATSSSRSSAVAHAESAPASPSVHVPPSNSGAAVAAAKSDPSHSALPTVGPVSAVVPMRAALACPTHGGLRNFTPPPSPPASPPGARRPQQATTAATASSPTHVPTQITPNSSHMIRVMSPTRQPSPERAFLAALPRGGQPTESDSEGSIYAFVSPQCKHVRGCVKVGRSYGDREHALARVRDQERHWSRCDVLVVMATKYNRMAEQLAHRVLDWRDGSTVELRSVSCAQSKCDTKHREWFTWKRSVARERVRRIAARMPPPPPSSSAQSSGTGKSPAADQVLSHEMCSELWRERVLPAMLWAVSIADGMAEGGADDEQ